MPETFDHEKCAVKHGMARVNGIRLHYITAGHGPALLLLHGTPKTHYYWYKIMPHLTPHFSVVAPDLRGFGATDKPPASEGYDGATNAKDMIELMDQLGHEKFAVHGEDRGATYAFCLAGLYRDRVTHLSFCEMVLSNRLTTQCRVDTHSGAPTAMTGQSSFPCLIIESSTSTLAQCAL
jgi:pimeloyl-ACP methyl ester carboxylesterase